MTAAVTGPAADAADTAAARTGLGGGTPRRTAVRGDGPSAGGFRVGITSTRKVEELTALLERRGADVESAPAMAIDAVPDDAALRAATRSCIDVPPDLFVATTGLGCAAGSRRPRRGGCSTTCSPRSPTPR